MAMFKRSHMHEDIGLEFFHRNPVNAFEHAWAMIMEDEKSEETEEVVEAEEVDEVDEVNAKEAAEDTPESEDTIEPDGTDDSVR